MIAPREASRLGGSFPKDSKWYPWYPSARTSTLGTQAAVEFVGAPNSLEEPFHELQVSSASGLKPFEAVIHLKVARGAPVGADPAALRTARP